MYAIGSNIEPHIITLPELTTKIFIYLCSKTCFREFLEVMSLDTVASVLDLFERSSLFHSTLKLGIIPIYELKKYIFQTFYEPQHL